jgi:hypothetical protein
VVLATQNPIDLDYRALSNAGLWFLGRLQTDADRARVIEAMENPEGLDDVVKRLAPRWFVVRDAHATPVPLLLHRVKRSRTCMGR